MSKDYVIFIISLLVRKMTPKNWMTWDKFLTLTPYWTQKLSYYTFGTQGPQRGKCTIHKQSQGNDVAEELI